MNAYIIILSVRVLSINILTVHIVYLNVGINKLYVIDKCNKNATR